MGQVKYFGTLPRKTQLKWFERFRNGLLNTLVFPHLGEHVKSTYVELEAPIADEVDYLLIQIPQRIRPLTIQQAAELTREGPVHLERFEPIEAQLNQSRTALRFNRLAHELKRQGAPDTRHVHQENKFAIEAFRSLRPAFRALREAIEEGKEYSLSIQEGFAVFVLFRP